MARVLRVLVGLALGAAALVAVDVSQPAPAPAAAGAKRPNIVFITTDDQRADDLQHMPYTRRLLGRHGYTFTQALSPHPLCCPARAEWLTGQYAQNNGVHHNTGTHGGYQALRNKRNTVARWLRRAGYRTAMVGKFMNGYRGGQVPHWNEWNPLVKRVYDYSRSTFWNDGEPRQHRQHVDDVVTAYAAKYIRRWSGRRPFFIWASHVAPHSAKRRGNWVPPVPALRHRGSKKGVRSPAVTDPAFGQRDGFNKQVESEQVNDAITRRRSTKRHQRRIESLQAVDEGVRKIVRTLRGTGELRNTYVAFMSDNGFLLGEHAIVHKNYLYDETLRVPLVVRVPGRTGRRTSDVPVTAVDVAPTFVDVAGAVPRRRFDGTSFRSLLEGREMPWRDTQLIQTGRGGDHAWATRGVRTGRWMYARAVGTGREQLINRADDPHELHNLADEPAYGGVLAQMRARLEALQSCAGESCRQPFGPVQEPGAP